MVAILGDSAKHPTANIMALESMPWSTDEYYQLDMQFKNLASIPNYPGSYIIGRYTQFAFLAAVDDLASPTDELYSYINTINKEITRKRDEFDLETLEVGQTLADKRIAQIKSALEALTSDAKTAYAEQIKAVNDALAAVPKTSDYIPTEDINVIRDAADTLRAAQYSRFYDIADMLDVVADCLTAYQASY